MGYELSPLYIHVRACTDIAQLCKGFCYEIEPRNTINDGHRCDRQKFPQHWQIGHFPLRLKSLLSRYVPSMPFEALPIREVKVDLLPAPKPSPRRDRFEEPERDGDAKQKQR